MAEERVCQGYKVIKSRRIKDVEIVLAHNPNAPSPYVTWKAYAHSQFLIAITLETRRAQKKISVGE